MSTRLVTTAPVNTLCEYSLYGSLYGTGRKDCGADHGSPALAVHVLTVSLPVAPQGTALCAYHSPYDVTPEERAPKGVSLVKEYGLPYIYAGTALPYGVRRPGFGYSAQGRLDMNDPQALAQFFATV